MKENRAIISDNLRLKDAFNIIAPEPLSWENVDGRSIKLMLLDAEMSSGTELLQKVDNIRVFVDMLSKKLTNYDGDEETRSRLSEIFRTLASFIGGIDVGRKVASAELDQ